MLQVSLCLLPLVHEKVSASLTGRTRNRRAAANHLSSPTYDDSDGWYDHVMPPVVNESQTAYDFLTAPDDSGGQSGTNAPLGGYQGRFSSGPRMPLIVISPFSKKNYVDHTVTDQSSIVRFIEDNWKLGRIGDSSFDQYSGTLLNMLELGDHHRNQHARRLILDPQTGESVNDRNW
jgi:phospholipase C